MRVAAFILLVIAVYASTPYHGASANLSVEDALVLAHLME